MLSMDEQRILRQIEHGLHHDDPRFGLHLTMVWIRGLRHRRSARTFLVVELAFVALAAVGTVYNLPILLVLGTGFGVLLPLVALVCWLPPPQPPDAPPTPPPTLWYW